MFAPIFYWGGATTPFDPVTPTHMAMTTATRRHS